jgi:hypothetical protein
MSTTANKTSREHLIKAGMIAYVAQDVTGKWYIDCSSNTAAPIDMRGASYPTREDALRVLKANAGWQGWPTHLEHDSGRITRL